MLIAFKESIAQSFAYLDPVFLAGKVQGPEFWGIFRHSSVPFPGCLIYTKCFNVLHELPE